MSEPRRIKLADATASELALFASTVLGIECSAEEGRDALIAKIRPAWTRTTIELDAEAVDAAGAKRITPKDIARSGRKIVRIRIPSTDQVGGKEPVPVSVNGKAMYIPRDEDVDVPAEYVEALNHAKRTVYDHHPERGLINRREVLRHSYQVVA